MKQLAATKAELDGISKIAEHYKDDSHLNGDCREEQLKKYLQSQLNCVLQNTASSSLLPATNTTSASYVDVKVNTTRAPPPPPPASLNLILCLALLDPRRHRRYQGNLALTKNWTAFRGLRHCQYAGRSFH